MSREDMDELKRWVKRHDITVTYIAVILTVMLIVQFFLLAKEH